MKNYIGPGNTQAFTAGRAYASGEPVLIGTLVGICVDAVANGAAGLANIGGVYSVSKADSQAWTVGAKVYWDDTNKVFTTTSSGNTLCGTAVEAVASTAGLVTGVVRLSGIAH
jgi:predicted RecA/RadA family phage recombinase